MMENIKKFQQIKWKDMKVGQTVYIPGNLKNGEPSVCYGPHYVVNPDKFLLRSGFNDNEFPERWPCLYVRKKVNYYDKQLQSVLPKKVGINGVKIKVMGPGILTSNWLDLNLESIESLRTFIDIVKEGLEAKK